MSTKIDLYNHVHAVRYLEMMKSHSKDAGIVKRMTSLRMLWDIEARVAMLGQWPELKQVLTLSLPAPELAAGRNSRPSWRVSQRRHGEMVRNGRINFPRSSPRCR